MQTIIFKPKTYTYWTLLLRRASHDYESLQVDRLLFLFLELISWLSTNFRMGFISIITFARYKENIRTWAFVKFTYNNQDNTLEASKSLICSIF